MARKRKEQEWLKRKVAVGKAARHAAKEAKLSEGSTPPPRLNFADSLLASLGERAGDDEGAVESSDGGQQQLQVDDAQQHKRTCFAQGETLSPHRYPPDPP